MIRALAILMLLAGCGSNPPPPAAPPVPARLKGCPDDPVAPAPLPVVRTIEQLGAGYIAERTARQRTRAVLVECRRRLDERNALPL